MNRDNSQQISEQHLWQALDLQPGDFDNLRRGWNYFAKKFHPDLGGDHDRYVLAKKSFDFLMENYSKPNKKLKKIIRLTLEQLHTGKTLTLSHGQHVIEITVPPGGFANNFFATTIDNIDVEFVFEILPNANFKIQNGYLISRQPVNALDLLLDKKIYFQTLFGEALLCYNTALRNNNLVVFAQKGIWYHGRLLDLAVEPQFVFPELNAETKQEISRCLKT